MKAPNGWGKPSKKGHVYHNNSDVTMWIAKQKSRWCLIQFKDGYTTLGKFNTMTEAANYYEGKIK